MLLQQISETQADLIKSFALFYLLLVGNYVGQSIFTCVQIKAIKKHKWLPLVISFFLFYFLVTVISDTGKVEFVPPIEKLINSIFYFMGFLILMRLDITISALVLLLIFVLYFLELNKDFYLDVGASITNKQDQDIYNANKYWITFNYPYKIRLFQVKPSDFDIINLVESVIYYIIIALLVIGFISYGGEIHDTVKNSNLTWFDVITDTNICRLQNKKSILHYLTAGIGIKL
jgi:hypothetical protein